jgi:hypothetical protein
VIYAIKLLFAVLLTAVLASRAFRSSFDGLLTRGDYRLAWRQIVLASIAAYLCKFPVLFLAVLTGIALFGASATGRGTVGKLATFLVLTIVLPPVSFTLGGLDGLNYVTRLTPERVLSLVLLVPAALQVAGMKKARPGAVLRTCDWLVLLYQVLRVAFIAPYSSFTTIARTGFEESVDILLPYYVMSRGVRSVVDLRYIASNAMVGLVFAASIGVMECLLQHNLYSGLQSVYGVQWQLTYALMRGGLLRVEANMTEPIILAFAMMYALGLWFWLKGAEWRKRPVSAVFILLSITLVGTFSRGPWLGTGCLFLVILGAARLSPRALGMLLIAALGAGVALKLAGGDEIVMSGLGSLFGSSSADLSSIDYRRQLLDDSIALLKQRPWTGVPDYQVQLQSLRQGEGIIDIVNTYIVVMLNTGVIGLALYLLPYWIIIRSLLRSLPARRDDPFPPGNRRFVNGMVSLTVASLITIFTTSTIGLMPLLLLMLLALPRAWLAIPSAERTDPNPVEGAALTGLAPGFRRDAMGRPFGQVTR